MNNHQSESQTRQEIIDKRLEKASWDVNDPAQVTANTAKNGSHVQLPSRLPHTVNIVMKN